MKALLARFKGMALSVYNFMKRIILNFLHALTSEDNLFFLAGAGGIVFIGGLLTGVSLLAGVIAPVTFAASESIAAITLVFTIELALMFAALYLAICMVEAGVNTFLNHEGNLVTA